MNLLNGKLKTKTMTKKDFALDLKNCLKKDRRKVNGLAKTVGFTRYNPSSGFHKRHNIGCVYYCVEDKTFNYCDVASGGNIYQMPQDWQLIQEALGIEVDVEPKNGEVWTCMFGGDCIAIMRIKDGLCGTLQKCMSLITASGRFRINGSFAHDDNNVSKFSKATPEETTKLSKAEHSNGYHWDGKDLVKIWFDDMIPFGESPIKQMFKDASKVGEALRDAIKYAQNDTRIKELEEQIKASDEAALRAINENTKLKTGFEVRDMQHKQMYKLLNEIFDSNIHGLSNSLAKAKVKMDELFPF